MPLLKKIVWLFLGMAILLPVRAQQQPISSSLEARLARLEQQLITLRKAVLDQDNKLTQQQEDIQKIQGERDVLLHKLEQIEKQQQDIYLDIDQRLQVQEEKATTQQPVEAMSLSEETISASPDTVLTLETTPPVPEITTTSSALPEAVEATSLPKITTTSPVLPEVAEAPETFSETTDRSPDTPTTTVLDVTTGDKQLYERIFNQVQTGDYEKSIIDFSEFISSYPSSDYADDAYFWLGESQYVLKKLHSALTTFNTLLERYPDSSKSAQALLKIGYIYHEQQDYVGARKILEKVKAEYPNTAAARLADERLQKIQ